MVRYSIEIGQKEQDILKEIVLASDKNVKKRKFATGLSSVMAVIMLIYTILCFMNSRIGYGIIGLLFSVFFIWIIINGANTFQKKVINIVHSKMDNKLTSGKREYCFDIYVISENPPTFKGVPMISPVTNIRTNCNSIGIKTIFTFSRSQFIIHL